MRLETDALTPILSVRDLEVCFATEHGMVPVVSDVSFDVAPGEVLGLVGESGCGKSVTSLAIMRLIQQPAGRITAGEIEFEGTDLLGLSERAMQSVRGGRIAMVFQEPMVSLDPAFTVGEQIASVYRRHCGASKQAAWEKAVEMLSLVGIPHARQRTKDYPHMFSGGMRQRVMIAIALVCGPSLLIADEPTTALDVTIQAQVLDLLHDLQARLGMAVILVTHDLGVVAELCERVVVMYAGQVVETGQTHELFAAPRHPYTSGLLECLPSEHFDAPLRPIPGRVPVAPDMPTGCRFHPRCPHAELGRCDTSPIPLVEVGVHRLARCVRADEIILAGIAP
jgi:peptide/nickel transport system ATP-binding protein